MEAAAYDEMRALEDHHWWFEGRRRVASGLVRDALADQPDALVLEVGCGTGGNLAWMARDWPRARTVGLDLDAGALEHCSGRGLPRLVRADGMRIPLRDGSVDVVLALDVVEHFEDDAGLLAEFARVLRPGGRLVAAVPAHPWLWSPHDEFLHHHRRYRSGQLERLAATAGLTVRRRHGFNFLLLPPIAAVRLAKRLAGGDRPATGTDFFDLPRWVERALLALFRLEAAIVRACPVPAGVSSMLLAERRPATNHS
jgi:SAM-dependent methyltransferase